MKNLLRRALVVGGLGCALLAAPYWLPGMRLGDVAGANIGAGVLFALGAIAAAAGVGLAVLGALTRSGERWRFASAALVVAVVAVGVFLVGSAPLG